MKELLTRYPQLEVCSASIKNALDMMVEAYKSNGKMMFCGNGGSCADCDHIVGELMKGFLSHRPIKGAVVDNINSLYPDSAEYIITHLQEGIPANHSSFSNNTFSNCAHK